MKEQKMSEILAEVDDEIYNLTKRIQKKHKLTLGQARNLTNRAMRILMLSFPEKWIK